MTIQEGMDQRGIHLSLLVIQCIKQSPRKWLRLSRKANAAQGENNAATKQGLHTKAVQVFSEFTSYPTNNF